MRALESALQWLRPLVESKTWDYCVVWKFGDDPSRFIEWSGCCCGGSYGVCINAKEESGEEHHQQSLPLCRDSYIKHPAETNACVALAHLPSSMPLYSGIHGEAVMSTEARWNIRTKDSNSNQSHESIGTQVLIPVVSGLIELFSAKQIPEDQKIVEFITSRHKVTVKQEEVTAQSYSTLTLSEQHHDPSLVSYLKNRPAPFHSPNVIPRLKLLPLVLQTSTCPSFERSSTGSNPSNEQASFYSGSVHVSPTVSVNEPIEKYPASVMPCRDESLSPKQEIDILGSANHVVENDCLISRKRKEREQYKSKNLVTERNRRNRIKDGLLTLRSLVPNISKMDKAAILGDAVVYIEELHEDVKKLQDELRETDKEESGEEIVELEHKGAKISTAAKSKYEMSCADGSKQTEVQVEVNQIGSRDFLIKVLCNKKRGGFSRLVEAVSSLGLQVIDARVTTLDGKISSILLVEVNKMGVQVQPMSLKDSLIKLTS